MADSEISPCDEIPSRERRLDDGEGEGEREEGEGIKRNIGDETHTRGESKVPTKSCTFPKESSPVTLHRCDIMYIR